LTSGGCGIHTHSGIPQQSFSKEGKKKLQSNHPVVGGQAGRKKMEQNFFGVKDGGQEKMPYHKLQSAKWHFYEN
jgi:hypothetical protein